MRPLREWRRLSRDERRLTLKALWVVAFVRLGLTIASYRRLVRWMPSVPEVHAGEPELRRVAVAVKRAARIVPCASCLTQALAAQYLLACRGHYSRIRIGVRKRDGVFAAHAWLLSGDQVVLGGGGHDLRQYSVLADLGPRSS